MCFRPAMGHRDRPAFYESGTSIGDNRMFAGVAALAVAGAHKDWKRTRVCGAARRRSDRHHRPRFLAMRRRIEGPRGPGCNPSVPPPPIVTRATAMKVGNMGG